VEFAGLKNDGQSRSPVLQIQLSQSHRSDSYKSRQGSAYLVSADNVFVVYNRLNSEFLVRVFSCKMSFYLR